LIAPEPPDAFTRLTDRATVWLGDLARHEQTNVGVIRGEDSVIVIDANFAGAARRIHAGIEGRVAHQVNTHYHADHTLGNVVFVEEGATVIGAAGQRRELLEKGRQDAIDQTGEAPDRLYPATIEFSDRLTFHDHDLQLIRIGAAHSGSDLIAWRPSDRVLFVGDLAVDWDHGNNFSDADADIDGWISALQRCIALDPQVVVPAHGRIADPGVLTDQLDFIVDAWGVANAVADGTRPTEDLTSQQAASRFVERHPAHAVDPDRFHGMATALLTAARKSMRTRA
jgi:cyclase